MKKIFESLSYFWLLLRLNLKTNIVTDSKKWLTLSFFMIVQDALFFSLWVILFNTVSDLKGWDLTQVARMFGIAAMAIGLSLFLFNGVRSLAYIVQDGSFDLLLTKPRSPLPLLLCSSSSVASFGDILAGPLIWIVFGDVTPLIFAKLLFFSLVSSVIFTAGALIVFSVAFWLKGNSRFSEQMFEILIIISCNVQHGQPIYVRVITYSLLPVAFMTLVPLKLVDHFDWALFIILLSVTSLYAVLSTKIFFAGVKRYKSAQI